MTNRRIIFIILFAYCTLSAVSGQWSEGCPHAETISPCKCSQRNDEVQVWCSHSILARIIATTKVLTKYMNGTIDELILENNQLPALPGRFFSSLKIMRLMLRDNSLERLSAGWLNDLDDRIVEIFIAEHLLRSVPLDSLNGLKRLEAVTIQSENLKHVPEMSNLPALRYININSSSLATMPPFNFKNLRSVETIQISGSSQFNRLEAGTFIDLPKLQIINLADNGLLWMHNRAMAGLPSLHTLILSGNRFTNTGMIGRAIKDLIALRVLKLDRNHITILEEASFVDLQSLQELYLNDNAITEIQHGAFHRTPNLIKIHLENNQLKHIHPESFLQSSGSGVEILHMQHNDLYRIEAVRSLLDALPMLKHLDVSHNRLEEIRFGSLRGHGNLEQLYLNDNNIRLIEKDAFMAMPGLRELRLRNNSLSNSIFFPIWNLPALKGLDLSYNNFVRLDGEMMIGLPQLRSIDISANELVLIDPSTFVNTPFMETINISFNEINNIHPSTFRSSDRLFEIDASFNNLQDFIQGLPRIVERVNVRRNKISSLPATSNVVLDLPNLRMLDMSENLVKHLPDNVFKRLPQLRFLSLAKNKLQAVGKDSLNGLEKIEIMDLQENGIKNFHEKSFNMLRNIRILNVQGNRLEALNGDLFHNAQQLEYLDMSMNNIGDIAENAFRNSRSLHFIDLSNNNLREVPRGLGRLGGLRTIDMSYNALRHLSPEVVASWPQLEELRASSNKLPVLQKGTFRNLSKLSYLDLSTNELGMLEVGSFENLPVLQEVVLAENQIVEFNGRIFDNLPSLQAVHLQQNNIRFIGPESFYRAPSIVYLNLSTNSIRNMEDVDLRESKNLEVLDMSNNHIKRMNGVPLRSLEFLVELKLDNNEICRVEGEPFNTMPRLRVLSMKNNRMIRLPERTFKSLRENIAILDFDGNPLNCSCEMIWLMAWIQETGFASHTPRCRDGSRLSELRMERSDCEIERNLNQLPMTNEHGDLFVQSRLQDDGCESEYPDNFVKTHPGNGLSSEYSYSDTRPLLPPPQLPPGFNRTLLNANNLPHPNQHQNGNRFTFFGVPISNLMSFWNNGRNDGKRVLDANGKLLNPYAEENNQFRNNQRNSKYLGAGRLNATDVDRFATSDSFFQTSTAHTGFAPMLPGVGGFKPIDNPYLITYKPPTENDTQEQQATSAENVAGTWSNEFQEVVPLITEPTVRFTKSRPPTDETTSQLESSLEVGRKQISSERVQVRRTTEIPPTTESLEVRKTSSTSREYVTQATIRDHSYDSSQSIEVSDSRPFDRDIFTTKAPIMSTAQTLAAPSTSTLPTVTSWGSENSYSNKNQSQLMALVAPGAQQGIFRPAHGRSTIKKVPSPQSNEDAETTSKRSSTESEPNELTTSFVTKVEKPKGRNMDWYFENYNRTGMEPQYRNFRTNVNNHASKIHSLSFIYLVIMSIIFV